MAIHNLDGEYLSIKEVADSLRVSESTVRRMIQSGELAAIRVRRQWRVSLSELSAYLITNTERGVRGGKKHAEGNSGS